MLIAGLHSSHPQHHIRDLAANIEEIIVAGCAAKAAPVASESVRAPGSAARVLAGGLGQAVQLRARPFVTDSLIGKDRDTHLETL